MDTRFWGPSGWKLFHLITFNYEYSKQNALLYKDFFETIPYILPCKFCRASLTDYYRIYPINEMTKESFNMTKWMYDIHNCVNNKLRKQGLNPNTDPPFSKVSKYFNKLKVCPWEQQLQLFWNFLFSVAYNHPKESSVHSKPMPECPPEVYKCNDNCEKNKWNILPLEYKLYWFKRFWINLPAVLPIEIQKRWRQAQIKNPITFECRRSILAWLWRMRCMLDSSFKDPYTSICKQISSYSSDCGKKPRSITCRRKRKTVKKKKE
jgi:hypothetical protein